MVRHNALKGFYELERTIGCGGFAKVKLATHLATGEKVAIKIMEKSVLKDDLPRVKLELKALKNLCHKHICKLYQVIETDTHFFIVIEYCSGGELFDHIVEKNRLSEAESRKFFRQIVSAVAYLHSLGYAHRDLKPENVLLDYSQNLKLIDFGLCARPEGGMQSLLFTSCGSPTYAAPELVLGQQYLGPEVDVWAMGVLLYALLAGYLPFDDQNIDALYKKILSGKYDEPYFMSYSSRRLIKEMLQVDPKKRITVNQLLTHPWMLSGNQDPVKLTSENLKTPDDYVISLMALYHSVTKEEMWKHLKRWRYDYDTATYLLLVARKKRGLPLELLPGAVKLPIRIRSAETINAIQDLNECSPRVRNRSNDGPMNHLLVKVENTRRRALLSPMVKVTDCNTPKRGSDLENLSVQRVEDLLSPETFAEPRRPSSIRKPLKRIRSPNMDGEYSPIPIKKTTPSCSTPKTPDDRKSIPNSGDVSSARKVLGSIERSLNRVRHVLIPKRSPSKSGNEPAFLTNKDLCNVSTTQCTDPEFVISELSKALQKKGIQCERKGFTIRGKMEPNVLHRLGGCSFELEICYLPAFGGVRPSQNGTTPKKTTPSKRNIIKSTGSDDFTIRRVNGLKVGVRRKRLKGDSWCYKKVCEEVLALTSTELKQTESEV